MDTEWYLRGRGVTIKAGAVSKFGAKFERDTKGTLARDTEPDAEKFSVWLYEPVSNRYIDNVKTVVIPREFVEFEQGG